ncbi:MAG TPA: flippase activity-associated protein Agl23, partial [Dehalococcoidia bacterium]|nr:flippase activity-associated protein Agl23 [Dehalococcoidia bacterium]
MSGVSLDYQRSEEGVLSRLLSTDIRINTAILPYLTLVFIGAGFRFWDLGSRALHHDESLHAYYGWNLFKTGVYEHLPLMHGPFQFFGIAFFYLLFGASDYTARILPALLGSALIGLPYFLRDRLGQFGALAASFLLAFSPTFLYYSRFVRNDIYMALFTLGIVICIWRHLDRQKPLYLYLAAMLLGLSFATKENAYINTALFLVFLNLWLAAHFWQQVKTRLDLDAISSLNVVLVFSIFAWAIAATWQVTGKYRRQIGLNEWHPAGDLMVVLGTLTLPQLAAAVQIPLESLGFGEDELGRVVSNNFLGFSTVDREQVLAVVTIAALTLAAAAVGLRWNWRLWAIAAAAFYIPYVLLYTSFFTNGDGFYSGNWGSLDYWLAQQDVRRGDQPDFYYLVLLPAYEFLPLLFAGPALLYYALRGGLRSWLLTLLAAFILLMYFGGNSVDDGLSERNMGLLVPIAAIAFFFALSGSPFERFLAFWCGATLFGYSAMAEKMPWLSVHTTLPFLLLAAYTMNKLFQNVAPGWSLGQIWAYKKPLLALSLGLASGLFAAYGPSGEVWVALRVLSLLVALSGALLLLVPAKGEGEPSKSAVATAGGTL